MLEFAILSALGLAIGIGLFSHLNSDDEEPGETIEGTEENDTLTGTERDDFISGLAGDDLIEGEGGDDKLHGDEGDDLVIGGEGNDTIRGQEGDDTLFGNEGDDWLGGDTGRDWVDGGAGDDEVKGGYGSDLVIGGEGEDIVEGGAGDDVVIGGTGPVEGLDELQTADLHADLLAAGEWNADNAVFNIPTDDGEADTLDGGDGDDMLIGGAGDTMTGGEGQDLFVLLDSAGVDPATITDYDAAEDALVVQYENGQPEPMLELTENEDGTQTLSADGVAIAVLNASSLSTSDILLVQRPPSA